MICSEGPHRRSPARMANICSKIVFCKPVAIFTAIWKAICLQVAGKAKVLSARLLRIALKIQARQRESKQGPCCSIRVEIWIITAIASNVCNRHWLPGCVFQMKEICPSHLWIHHCDLQSKAVKNTRFETQLTWTNHQTRLNENSNNLRGGVHTIKLLANAFDALTECWCKSMLEYRNKKQVIPWTYLPNSGTIIKHKRTIKQFIFSKHLCRSPAAVVVSGDK